MIQSFYELGIDPTFASEFSDLSHFPQASGPASRASASSTDPDPTTVIMTQQIGVIVKEQER
ncbi:MAG TPA: hypothetical protein VF719_08445, partial [Abditibacteriaceae bacterium]